VQRQDKHHIMSAWVAAERGCGRPDDDSRERSRGPAVWSNRGSPPGLTASPGARSATRATPARSLGSSVAGAGPRLVSPRVHDTAIGVRAAAVDLEAGPAHINPSVPAQSARAWAHCAHRTADIARRCYPVSHNAWPW